MKQQPSSTTARLREAPTSPREGVARISPVHHPPFSPEGCQETLQLMAEETAANLGGLRLRGNPRPFFISNLLRHERGCQVRASYGALYTSREWEHARLLADIRVGNHRLDQVLDGGLHDEHEEGFTAGWTEAPVDLEPRGLRYSLWKLMQRKYEEVLQAYYEKRKVMVEEFFRTKVDSFSREPVVELVEPLTQVVFPRARWEEQARRISELFTRHDFIFDPGVVYWGTASTRFFVGSEGTRFATTDTHLQLSIQGWVRTRDGVYLPGGLDWYGRREEDLPDPGQLERAVEGLVAHLRLLQRAPALGAFVGPALLAGQAAAVFFHEAIGHRLEGERLISRSEGKTFLGKVGEQILPAHIHVHDDPTLTHLGSQPLFGAFRIDDQGVVPRRVTLVEHGRLAGYLKSRAPIPGFPASNGHARGEGTRPPLARMGNLVASSEQRHTWAELVQLLRAECRRQGKRHGLIVEQVSGGETSTDAYDFQSFKGEPSRVWRLDARTGRQELVRDVSFIGTPLAALQKIIAAGGEQAADNGYCVAESGEIPVSNLAPPILLSELELQRQSTHSFHKPVLPLPWHRDGGG
ncbi:MAG: metallopeptidase TldD-related protein [Myxococcota bacterium]|jgi:predicted Zn-dependent protease|nr:metallopeptidase TldD-related protein [Myxococcota bacterium]